MDSNHWLARGADVERLEVGAVTALSELLNHSSEAVAKVEYYPVSRSVNKVQKSKGVPNDGPELVESID